MVPMEGGTGRGPFPKWKLARRAELEAAAAAVEVGVAWRDRIVLL